MTLAAIERATDRPALSLRSYQATAIERIEAQWASGVRATALVLPTGTGKTVTFSHIIARHLATVGGRVLVIAHREELIDQAVEDVRHNFPGIRVGVVAADRDETFAPVIVGSVQTLRSERRRKRLTNITLIVTDECHHAVASSYRTIYDAFSAAKMLGVTATLSRADGKPLDQVWESIAYEYKLMQAIHDGYLVDVKGIRVEVPDLDLAKVRKVAGDYSNSALGEALEVSLAPQVVATAMAEHIGDESSILFSPTVHAAEMFSDALIGRGISSAIVHGGMRKSERRRVLADLRHGRVQTVCNCMVLTEGTNIPNVSVIALARPTRSKGLGIQMVGRGMRLHPGKSRCLVLDVSGSKDPDGLDLFSVSDLAGRPVKPGLSILESEEEDWTPEPKERREKPIHFGATTAKEFDPLAAGRIKWNQTPAGFWFVADSERYMFIMPGAESGTFDIGWKAIRYPIGGKNADITATGLPSLADAKSAIEDTAIGSLSRANGSWRNKAVSVKMAKYARSLGIEVMPDDKQGVISDKINGVNAVALLDRVFMPWIADTGRDMSTLAVKGFVNAKY